MQDKLRKMRAAIRFHNTVRATELLSTGGFDGVQLSDRRSILSHAIINDAVEIVTKLIDAGAQLTDEEKTRYSDPNFRATKELREAFAPALGATNQTELPPAPSMTATVDSTVGQVGFPPVSTAIPEPITNLPPAPSTASPAVSTDSPAGFSTLPSDLPRFQSTDQAVKTGSPASPVISTTMKMENAIVRNDIGKVEELLKTEEFKGVKMVESFNGYTILSFAITFGSDEIVTKLIEAGAQLTEGEKMMYSNPNFSATKELREAFAPALNPTNQTELPAPPAISPNLPPEPSREIPTAPIVGQSGFPPSPDLPSSQTADQARGTNSSMPPARPQALTEIEAHLIIPAQKFVKDMYETNAPWSPNMEGFNEWQFLRAIGELAIVNSNAIDKFANAFKAITEGKGNAGERDGILDKIHELHAIFSPKQDAPGTNPAAQKREYLDSINSLIGQFYANNPELQKQVSIKDFTELMLKSSQEMIDQLSMDYDVVATRKPLVIKPELILEPIEQAAASDKLARDGVIREEDRAYLKAIVSFKNSFNSMVGDRGRNSSEYIALSKEIAALHKLYSTQQPGTLTFSEAAQTHINNIQSLAGQFYANNSELQQHISIKNFMESVVGFSKEMVAKISVATAMNKPLTSNSDLMLEPIAHGAASGKMVRHDSALKNAEDSKYLASVKNSLIKNKDGHNINLARDVSKAIDTFNVVDKFKLAQIINEDPDRVVRYIKSLEGKGTPASDASIAAVGKMLDAFTSETTKKRMAEIASKVEGEKDVPWYHIATHISNAIERVKTGVEALIGYDDIADAIGELGTIYNIYGSLFKDESKVADTRATGFAERILSKVGTQRTSTIVGNFRKSVDALIADNGRGTKEFTVLLDELSKLEKLMATERNGPTSFEEGRALQNRMDRLAFAAAKLYTNNQAVQQHVPIREFSDKIAGSMKTLAEGINAKYNLLGDNRVFTSAKQALVKTLVSQPTEKIQGYGSDARKIDAQNYLIALKESWMGTEGVKVNPKLIESVDKLVDNLNAKDNFKLAELINKHPEKVMRVMKEMLERGALLPNATENAEAIDKVATVLDYLSSDKTKQNMAALADKIGAGGNVKGMIAQVAIAIEKGVNWLTGFDKEVENAFKELNNITAMQHDVIAKHTPVKTEIVEKSSKVGVRTFVERVSKPSTSVPGIS